MVHKLKPKAGIEKLRKKTVFERILELMGFDIFLCPVCKKGRLHRIEEIPKVRSPDILYNML
jgi:hypothetical protein